jgi:Ca2+-binding EF-hand superfamily protein
MVKRSYFRQHISDRLFAQFDQKGTGVIDFDEFVTGLATVCRRVFQIASILEFIAKTKSDKED